MGFVEIPIRLLSGLNGAHADYMNIEEINAHIQLHMVEQQRM